MHVRRILVLTVAALLAAAAPAPARAHDEGDLEAALDDTEAALREASEALAGLELPDLQALVEPAASGPTTRTEQSVEVKRGSTLELSNFAGDIVVRAGSGNRVRVVARHSPRERVTLRTEGAKVILECDSERMVPASVHYEITVPEWMNLDLSGVNSDITVEGVKGRVKAETVQGDVDLVRTSGSASIGSVQGGVRVEGARGRIEASAINGPVQILGADGAIVAESVNGEITLRDIASDSVDASTVNGPVRFAGKIRSRGLYRLASHNGSIRFAVPEDASARVRVATYRGGFDCSFPVSVHETKKGREYRIELGSGSADVTLETFQGWVILRRPGEADGEDDAHSRVRVLKKELRELQWKERDRESGEDD
jgi:hypothetical protein